MADGHAGRLREHRAVGVVPAQPCRQRAVGAAELLVHHRLDDHVAGEGDVTLGEAAVRVQCAGDAGLHVPRAAAVEAAVLDIPVPEPVRPRAQRRHDVHVPGQEQRAAAARAAAAADHARAALVAAPRPPQRVGDRGLDLVRPEHVDLGAGLVQARRDQLLAGPFVPIRRAVLAGERDQLAGQLDQVIAVAAEPLVGRSALHIERSSKPH